MTLNRTLTLTSAIALVTSGPALADLTAEQVLADQLTQMEFYGLDVQTTGQSRSGDVLTVDGLAATAEFPEGTMMMTIGGATFTELGNGSVSMTYDQSIPITFKMDIEDEDESVEFAMSIEQSGLEIVVSGIPEDIRYDYKADEVSFSDIQFIQPAEMSELDMNVDVTISGMVGVGEFSGTTLRDYTANFAFDSVAMAFSGTDPEGEGSFAFDLTAANLTADYEGKIAPQDLMASFAQTVVAGNETSGQFSHGAVRYAIKADGPDGAFEGDFNIGSGELDFKLDKSGLAYGGVNKDLTMTFGGSMIPFPPMSLSMAESGGQFAMPIVPSEDEQDFALSFSMIDLVLDPFLWSMFDPGEALPRDPATIALDLEGQGVLTQDIFDPELAEKLTGAPGQLNAVTLNELRLNIAGAELTGDGDFTFNNQGPIPMPAGVVNMMLTGGNGLLDTLVGMGLVPEEQAMGARMMMGLFARPGDGEDTLVSTIEMKEDGSVLANGQRIR